jgi:hypothetical protein
LINFHTELARGRARHDHRGQGGWQTATHTVDSFSGALPAQTPLPGKHSQLKSRSETGWKTDSQDRGNHVYVANAGGNTVTVIPFTPTVPPPSPAVPV